MKRTEVLNGVRMLKFRDVFGRWEKGRLSESEAADARGDGTHVPAMAAPLRGGGRERAGRSSAWQAIAEAGAKGGSGTDRAALPGAIPGLHGQALSRACRGQARAELELHVDQDLSAKSGLSQAGATSWGAPAQTATQAARRDDAASGRFASLLDTEFRERARFDHHT